MSIERQVDVNCTAPDNPNSLRFCDETILSIPFRKTFKTAGSYPLPYGVTFSASLQSNIPTTSSRTMAFTTGTTRYPADCPAPCPAGQIIVPRAVANQTSLTINLEPDRSVFVERITQLDIKVTRNFKIQRVTFSPVFEMFNLNNSDAIISYQSTSFLSQQYLAPNSIMQPRMIGVGATVKW
jgi:hypothetical protein